MSFAAKFTVTVQRWYLADGLTKLHTFSTKSRDTFVHTFRTYFTYTVRTCSHNVTRYTVCITLVYVSFSLHTLQDLRNSYVPEKTVQVAIQYTWWSTVCVYRRKFSLNLDSNTPKADRQLYDRPAAPVSPNSILPPTPSHCPFITARKTSMPFSKTLLFEFFLF